MNLLLSLCVLIFVCSLWCRFHVCLFIFSYLFLCFSRCLVYVVLFMAFFLLLKCLHGSMPTCQCMALIVFCMLVLHHLLLSVCCVSPLFYLCLSLFVIGLSVTYAFASASFCPSEFVVFCRKVYVSIFVISISFSSRNHLSVFCRFFSACVSMWICLCLLHSSFLWFHMCLFISILVCLLACLHLPGCYGLALFCKWFFFLLQVPQHCVHGLVSLMQVMPSHIVDVADCLSGWMLCPCLSLWLWHWLWLF